MIISRVARRYAGAIFASVDDDRKDAFFQDVSDLQSYIDQSKDLRNFFLSPIIERAKKLEIVEAIAKDRFGPQMLSVLRLLVDKDREALVEEILEALFDLRRQQLGIQPVTVSTAVPLDERLRNEVVSGLEGFLKGKVEVEYAVSEELKGGVVVRVEDTVYDGSIQRQLARLRRKFSSVS